MANSGRGYLIIFNMQDGREGSNVDADNLTRVFTLMGAEVHARIDDPSENDIRKVMGQIKKMDFSDYSYVAVAYLSHGSEDDLVKTDLEIIKAQKSILIPLCNIPSLDGKLKWLIMQTCRGSYDFLKQKAEGAVQLIKYPNYYAKFFATSEGMHAYRTEYGSYFIHSLCSRLESEYKNQDIISIMEMATLDVEDICKAKTNFRFIQKPEPEWNFQSKKFFITSGFSNN
ncbi:caspase-1-like [Episyrphus balteatus]|uniref:caspase-1-like n=1 Tax=Episyrphus balteatus TaxID=286459 RepID=UPI002484FBD1|nr:caspase-1-like [Episyrphus balteatus]